MGMPPFSKSCQLKKESPKPAPAPNPDPSRWEILEKIVYPESYALKVRYFDATNFDGVKVMVYRGKYEKRKYMDPHFENNDTSPVARFRPDDEGWRFAIAMAKGLSS